MMHQLREWREQHNLSQDDAAKKLRISPRQYMRWEYGECVPLPPKLALIRRVTGISPDSFLPQLDPEEAA